MRELGYRTRQKDLIVKALQCICLSVPQRRTACDAEDRASISESGRKTWKTITKAVVYQFLLLCITFVQSLQAILLAHSPTICSDKAAACVAADLSISFCSLYSYSLVPCINKLNAHI